MSHCRLHRPLDDPEPARGLVPDEGPDHAALPFLPAEAVADDDPGDGDLSPGPWREWRRSAAGRRFFALAVEELGPRA